MSSSASESFVVWDAAAPSSDSNNDDTESLASISSSVLSSDSADSDAQREWEASLEQLQLLLTMVIVPFAGKYLGRKFAYWSWAKYMDWAHNIEVRYTNKKTFSAAGAAEAAMSL
ncbi:hypothetical protein B0H63DRAFT_486769 [Podospora didyma]|uniref:Uncharacterized protein n=1 Tax=Podospora didyma TaxID=330526 RepID=A0AAE0K568_9PEZI|nr:hypothetical protein B0H63DRAFT_486769 [Podospora didyma]